MYADVLSQVLLVAGLIAVALTLAMVYLVSKVVFGGKPRDGYVFDSDGPAADRAWRAGNSI